MIIVDGGTYYKCYYGVRCITRVDGWVKSDG